MVSDVAFALHFLRDTFLFNGSELAGVKLREEDVTFKVFVNLREVNACAVRATERFLVDLGSSNNKHLVNLPRVDERLDKLQGRWEAGGYMMSFGNFRQGPAHHYVHPVAERPVLRWYGIPGVPSHDNRILLSLRRLAGEPREIRHLFLQSPRQGIFEAQPSVFAHCGNSGARDQALCVGTHRQVNAGWEVTAYLIFTLGSMTLRNFNPLLEAKE